MTAYWVSAYDEIPTRPRLPRTRSSRNLRLRLRAEGSSPVAFPSRLTRAAKRPAPSIIEFDSVEAARNAHESPAYQEALVALDGGAVRDIRIVPGV